MRLRAGLLGLGLCAWVGSAAAMVPPFELIRDGLQPSNVVLTDQAGTPLAEDFRPYQRLRLEWTPLRSLSPETLQTLLAAEDRRFFEHSGVDWRAFVSALWQNLWAEHLRGASTLTMQLAGLLDPTLRPRQSHGGRRTLGQKWDQTQAAAEIEAHWSKEQILEAYLNLATFRGNWQGVAAASHGLFGRDPSDLARPEAAILAVLLRAPDAPARRVRQRACRLLTRIGAESECEGLARLAPGLDHADLAPRWDAAAVLLGRIPGGGGQRLQTSLDAAWQVPLAAELGRLPEATRPAALLVGPGGRVLAYASRVARPDPWREVPPERAIVALRTAARLVDGGRLGPESLLNAPGAGDASWTSFRSALARRSLADTMASLDLPEREADAAGSAPAGPAPDGLSLATLLHALASDGAWQPARLGLAGEAEAAPVRLVAPAAAFVFARSWTRVGAAEGCARLIVLDESAEWSLTGMVFGDGLLLLRAEGPEARATTAALAERLADWPAVRAACDRAPPAPEGVEWRRVEFDPPVERPRAEWLLASNPTRVSRAGEVDARIAWPARRSIVDGRAALSDAAFQVEFVAAPAPPHGVWYLNGQRVGSGPRVGWRPRAGLYALELRTPDGRVLDSIEFAARGPL
ncbi:MAG: transglycosylase domain-containing protein [Rhodocyclaceae bacterium]|nr:transglycosylase domain-containing protein [Rhodocyclaceae bacterium]